MAELITTNINAGATAGRSFTLRDSDGVQVPAGSISAISYTWSDINGHVINEREDIVLTPANPVIIELEPLDTTLTASADTVVPRLLTLKWAYTDVNLGAGSVAIKEYEQPINRITN